MIIGNPHASNCVYLPHIPVVPNKWHWQQQDAMQQLLTANSNHWRKIWVISAKILDDTSDWRQFLQTCLLQQCCFYCDEPTLHSTAKLHFYSGQAIAEQMSGKSLVNNLKQRLAQDDSGHWHLPYFDYRQFPNALIESLRQRLSK
ncbi:DUF6942 family protein [Shewanella sp.]|uniref:DUF6942 family protein n=1 Tax=Shewanella sp. TaxID=50422 RepID=UPI003A9724BE